MKAVSLAVAGVLAALCLCHVALAADPPGAPDKTPAQKPANSGAPAAAADFVVLEAVANDAAITLTDVKSPNVVVTMTVVSKLQKPQRLALSTQLFTTSSDVTVPPDLLVNGKAGSALLLEPGKAYRVQLSARLIVEGTYRSHVTISSHDDGKPQVPLKQIAVTVTRTLADVPIDVTVPPVIAVIAPVMGTASTEATLLLQSRAGALDLRVPTAVKVDHRPKADSQTGVKTEVDAAVASKGPSLPADQSVEMKVSLSNIGSPGRYDVTMRFDQAGYKPVDKVVQIYARWDWWIPFAFIVLGVLASLLLQIYVKTTRPRLQVQARVAEMRTAIANATKRPGIDGRGKKLVETIETALESRWSKSRTERRVAAADFEIYERIIAALPLWIDLSVRRASLRPVSAGTQLGSVLDEAYNAFTAANLDAAKVEAAIKSVGEAPTTIRAAVVAALKTAADNLSRQLLADHRPEVVQLRNRVENVRALVARGEVDQAVVEWMAVLREHLQRFSDDLLRRVADDAAKPMGFDDNDWRDARDHTREQVARALAATDIEEGGAHLQRAVGDLQRTIAAGMERDFPGLAAEVRDRLMPAMEAMRQAIDGDDVAAIWRALDAVEAMRTGDTLGDGAGGVAEEAAFHAGVGIDVPARWEALGRPGAAARFASVQLRGDLAVSVIVVLIAGLVGVQQLWSENLTWGGGVAMLAAFLTGFATDQIAHAGVKAFLKV